MFRLAPNRKDCWRDRSQGRSFLKGYCSEEEGDVFTGKTFGIVTDVEKWYFMECSLDNEGKLLFKLSEPVTVMYKDENLQAKVE